MYPDHNSYEANAPIPNPYETTTYGAPPEARPNSYGYPPYTPNQPQQPGNFYGQGQNAVPPTAYASPQQPPVMNNPYQPYPVGAPPAPIYNQGNQPPNKRSSSGLRIVIIALIALVIVSGIIAAIAIPAHNNQIANANATATAQAQTQAQILARAQATANANATATVAANTYPFSTNLKLSDPLTDNSKGNGWDSDSNCSFTGGAYHTINTSANTYTTCIANQTSFSNFTYEVTMQITKGSGAGIVFRANAASSKSYAFALGNDGSYIVAMYANNGKGQILQQGNAGAVTQFQANQPNQLAVVAKDSKLALYVNKQSVTTVNDTTLGSGQIGMITYDLGQNAEAVFSNAKVWAL